SSRRRHTRSYGDWSSDVCSSDLFCPEPSPGAKLPPGRPTLKLLLQGLAPKCAGLLPPQNDGSQTRLSPFLFRSTLLFLRLEQKRSEERRVGKECGSRWAADQCNI